MLPGWLAILIFFSLLTLLVASQLYWFRRAQHLIRTRQPAWLRWLLGVPCYAWFFGLLGMFVLLPLRWALLRHSPVLLSLFQIVRQPLVMTPVALWLTASLFSFLLILFVQTPAFLSDAVRRLRRPPTLQPERRYFLQTATYAAGALPFVMVSYGFLIGRQNYRVQEVTVPLPNLPSALDGLRLLQLTDVHASAYMPPREIRRIVGLAGELDADLVFHTGDFVTSRGDPLEEAIAELSRAPARYGVFGCLGNHEIYAGATEAATQLFARRGGRILRGESALLEIRGAKLNLIGVDYERQPRGWRPDEWKKYFLRGVERLVRPDALNILLSHNPNPFVRAAELGIELTLAGHTHGGQVQVEILDSRWNPARFLTPFISGLYEDASSLPSHESPPDPERSRSVTSHSFLYVSRGLGTVGTPIRINAPPEITVLTLQRA